MSCGVAGAVVEVWRAPGHSGRVNSSRGNHDARSPFPPEMLGQARAPPDGWLYAVDPAFAPTGRRVWSHPRPSRVPGGSVRTAYPPASSSRLEDALVARDLADYGPDVGRTFDYV